uniref:REST corepressor n=1 Tax=Panagrolaimus superbus TaxID=310955 RepID=A0A914Z1U4_9BILA
MSQTENSKIVTRSKARQGGGNDRIESHHKPPKIESVTNGTASQMHSKERKEVRLGECCQVPLTDVENSYIGPDGWEIYSDDLDIMVWNGGKGLEDDEVFQYLKHAAQSHKIPADKALYILHSCNNDIAKTKLELFAHINLDDQWTTDDDRVFWYAFHAFGKNFAKIKQLLPHKKMPSIVNHYYATKKHQNYRSVLNDEMGKNATFELSDDEETEPLKRALFYICKNCGASVKRTYYVNLLEVCKACKLYFKVANEHRPVNRPRQFDKRVKCPPEMLEIALKFEKMGQESSRTYDDDEDIVCVDRPARTICDDLIQEAHKEIESKKAKAHILSSKNLAIDYNEMCDIKKATETLEKISNEKTASRQRNSHTWSDFEQAAAYHCLVRFNLDYEAVAEVIGNKSTDMVKAFALENLEQIQKAIEQKRSREVEINWEDERPKAPPAEIIDLE